MKKLFIFCTLFFISLQFISAQKTLPIIHATAEKSIIVEGDEKQGSDWYLTPEAKPDVYILDKCLATKKVVIYTDIDSLKMELAPGEEFDFIVLLNGKDSCHNRFINEAPITVYKDQMPATHDTIPFWLTEGNNIIVQTLLNNKDTLDLNFDSGAHYLALMRDSIIQKTSLLDDQPDVKEGKAEPDFRKMSRYNSLQIGELAWDSVLTFPIPIGGQGSDGRFAWDIFGWQGCRN